MEEPKPYPEALPVEEALCRVVYIRNSLFKNPSVINDLLEAISLGKIYIVTVFILCSSVNPTYGTIAPCSEPVPVPEPAKDYFKLTVTDSVIELAKTFVQEGKNLKALLPPQHGTDKDEVSTVYFTLINQ